MSLLLKDVRAAGKRVEMYTLLRRPALSALQLAEDG
jgi:hypothetical protein